MKGNFLYLNPFNSVIIPTEDKESKTKTKEITTANQKNLKIIKDQSDVRAFDMKRERTLLNNHKRSVRFLYQPRGKGKKAKTQHF